MVFRDTDIPHITKWTAPCCWGRMWFIHHHAPTDLRTDSSTSRIHRPWLMGRPGPGSWPAVTQARMSYDCACAITIGAANVYCNSLGTGMYMYVFNWKCDKLTSNWTCTSSRTKRKVVRDDTEAPWLRAWDFDAVYYMGVHNRSGGNPPSRL